MERISRFAEPNKHNRFLWSISSDWHGCLFYFLARMISLCHVFDSPIPTLLATPTDPRQTRVGGFATSAKYRSGLLIDTIRESVFERRGCIVKAIYMCVCVCARACVCFSLFTFINHSICLFVSVNISKSVHTCLSTKYLSQSCELNYHDQNIQQTLKHDIRKYWTAVSTLLDLISSAYRDLHHWISNQRP